MVRGSRFTLQAGIAASVLVGGLLFADAASAQQAGPASQPATAPFGFSATGVTQMAMQTFGGKQLWGDELVLPGWHIQRHVLTGHFRLLDDADRRHAWGTFAQCHNGLQALAKETRPAPVDGDVVLLLHGLARSRSSMSGLADYLQEQSDFVPLLVGYPSTRTDVDQHAQALDRVISHLPKAKRIHLVAHSLGNIVIRRYLARQTDAATGRKPDARIGKIVMLCPPNYGATAAGLLSESDISRAIGGPAIAALGADWKQFETTLVTPASPFGILAGGRGDGKGFNTLIPGDDDVVISVATTRLAGARDFRVLPSIHTFFMDDTTVRHHTLHFLQNGSFEGEAERQPIGVGGR